MTKWIMVVDDDTANLQAAGHILSKNNMRVTALKSGKAMLDYIESKGAPDLILLDIKMPEMDGFETLQNLRQLEKKKGLSETPVIFLTADDNTVTETRGFEEGVSDFIRKPFNPDVLIRRLGNVLSMQSEMQNLKNEATRDKLTGFLNKSATASELSRMCTEKEGCILMIDLDSFKLVNDIFGHEMGDQVLIKFARIIAETVPKESKNGRIGGDEFVSFAVDVTTEEQVAEITKALNDKLMEAAKEMMGKDMKIPLGASVGAIYVPKYGNDYTSLLKYADKCLYVVKKNGKHGYSIYSADAFSDDELKSSNMNIAELGEIMGERTVPNVALQLEMEAFSHVYRYATRYFIRNNINSAKILFTLERSGDVDNATFKNCTDEFGNFIRESLRKSDLLTRVRFNQYYVLLSDMREEFVDKVVDQILSKWKGKYGYEVMITYEKEFVRNEPHPIIEKYDNEVVIVDDDEISLQLIRKILEDADIRVIAMTSGNDFLEYVDHVEKLPDLVLLDVNMPGMDGFETLEKLRAKDGDASRVAVLFITADNSDGYEVEGLAMGAMDYIKKPIIPEILLLRVNHILELVKFRKRFNKR